MRMYGGALVLVQCFPLINCATVGKCMKRSLSHNPTVAYWLAFGHRNTPGTRPIRDHHWFKTQIKYTYGFDKDIMILRDYLAAINVFLL